MVRGDDGNHSAKDSTQGKLSYDGHEVNWDDPSGSKIRWSREAFEECYGQQLPEHRHTFTNRAQGKGPVEPDYIDIEPISKTGAGGQAAGTRRPEQRSADLVESHHTNRMQEQQAGRTAAPQETQTSRTPAAPEQGSAHVEPTQRSYQQSGSRQAKGLSNEDVESLRSLLKTPGDTSNAARQSFNEEIRNLLKQNGIAPEETPAHTGTRGTSLDQSLSSKPGRTGVVSTSGEPVRTASTPEPATVEAGSKPLAFKSAAGTGFTTTLGVVGLVGGSMETVNGIRMINNGNVGEGIVQTSAGLANSTAGGASLFASRSALAGNMAMRAGGVGAVLDGGLTMYQGYQKGDSAQMVDGGVRLGLGGVMMAGGPAGALAGAAYGGWSVGRWIGGQEIGDRTVDEHVTTAMTSVIYSGEMQNAQNISNQNLSGLERQQSVLSQTADQLKAQGKTAKDVSEAILGLREAQEKAREQGRVEEAQKMAEETRRLIQVRSEMLKSERKN